MSSREFLNRLCRLLCELDQLVKEYFFDEGGACRNACSRAKDG